MKRATEIEELDKKVLDYERLNETLEIKKLGVERALELQKKQLNETIQSLRETLEAEKATRDQWIEKFEREQNDHTTTSTALM